MRQSIKAIWTKTLLFGTLLTPPGLAAQFQDSVTAVHMGGSVYMLQGAGDVITASVGPDGVLLVDDGFPQTVQAVRDALGKLGGGSPSVVINSHWHHAGANAAFNTDAVIIAHLQTRERLRTGSVMYVQEMPPSAREALPEIMVHDSLSLYFNGERIDIIHLPNAHTDSDLAVLFTESKVAALGDVFVTLIPVTDYPSGGDLYKSLDAIDFLLERLPSDVRIVPGHGQPADYDDLRAFREMLASMIAYVEGQISAGHSVEQLIAAGIPEQWQSWMDDLLTPEFVLQNLYEGVMLAR